MLIVLEPTVLERSHYGSTGYDRILCLRNVLEQTAFISRYVNMHVQECGFCPCHFQPGCAKIQVAAYQNVRPSRTHFIIGRYKFHNRPQRNPYNTIIIQGCRCSRYHFLWHKHVIPDWQSAITCLHHKIVTQGNFASNHVMIIHTILAF